MPALPLDEAGKYVAAAYVVFAVLLLVYVAIMATKLQRIDRELGDLANLAERKPSGTTAQGGSVGTSDGVAVQASDPAGRRASQPVGTRDEVPVQASEPAAPVAPEPADTGREAEDVGGGIPR
jgi:hypothetical protein